MRYSVHDKKKAAAVFFHDGDKVLTAAGLYEFTQKVKKLFMADIIMVLSLSENQRKGRTHEQY